MRETVDSSSKIWPITFVFAGAGSTFLGPFLPELAALWHINDHQAGLLVSCFFLGSFTGTLLLSSKLRKTLNVGSLCACLGLLTFAVCIAKNLGVVGAEAALVLMGFGLGQLMSSINLLVGAAEEGKRASGLARIAAAFCVGAILSPLLTTVEFRGIPAAVRLGFFALLFLVPLFGVVSRDLSSSKVSTQAARVDGMAFWRPAFICVALFFIYGGVEASVTNWLPLFATRYQLGPLGMAQWVVSLFWIGLSAGRILTMKLLKFGTEGGILRISMVASSVCLLWLIAAPSPVVLLVSCTVAGICIGPIFPLLLSSSIGEGLSERLLGFVLASCGLGAAVFPSLLGLASYRFSLRAGMLVPILGLGVMFAVYWVFFRKRIVLVSLEQN